MAARRGCVNSLWSGTERVRIGERLKATLAGVLELEVLRCKHLEMVDATLEERASAATGAEEPRAEEEEEEEVEEEEEEVEEEEEGSGTPESVGSDAEHGSATSRRQQAPSPSETPASACQSSPEDGAPASLPPGRGSNPRWSTLSWDAPSDLLSPPTPDPSGLVHLDSDSRPSSGFYSVSGSSLSDSCYSVSSEAAHGGPLPPARPLKLWEQAPLSADTLWSEGAAQPPPQPQPQQPQQQQQQQQQQSGLQSSQEDPGPPERAPVPVQSDLEASGLSFLSDLCSGLGDSLIASLLPLLSPAPASSDLRSKPQLDPRYCTDLVSRRTKEVYSYPSPLHAVALQSPLFTSHSPEPSGAASPEGPRRDEDEPSAAPAPPLQPQQRPAPASVSHLEQYIFRLARQHHSRVCSSSSSSSVSDLPSSAGPGPATHRDLCGPGRGHGSTQSLSAFESRCAPSTLPGGSVTPCKSLLGNSARVSLSTTGKKGMRNSINLGNLPSATGEDLNINLHLNLNLNLAPGLNPGCGLVDASKNGSCGALRGDLASAPTASASSLSSATPAPALRSRPRISTCPGSLSHRSSLEVPSASGASSAFGSSAFCRSLDWSAGAPPETAPFGASAGSAPGSQRSSLIQEPSSSPKLSEDSAVVGEISRLSGLSRAVVVGLMEQGVELDIDCFQTDPAGEVRGHSKAHLVTQRDPDYSGQTELAPQRPIQLSLSVTHSPQSQCSLTPPLSHSSSPIHPYQSVHLPSPHYSSHCHYQQTPPSAELPSSTASSPASRPVPRGRSPPRPLQPSPLGATPLSVFRRDAPFQCSLPRTMTRTSPFEHGGIQPRGGSLRQSGGGGGGGGGGGSKWRRAEGEGLYRGKHASHKLVRAATVSSYARADDYSSVWGDEDRSPTAAQTPRKSSSKLWRGFEGRLWGKESDHDKEELDRAEYGYGWRRSSVGSWRREQRRAKASSSSSSSADKRPKVDQSPVLSRRRAREDGERRSSSLRLSRRALFRSESQGLLVPHHSHEEPTRRGHWVSSLDVGHGGTGAGRNDGVRLLRAKEDDKRLSSTASLFNLSRSQSLEGSCRSLSPLSSPSFSPSPPRTPLQRSRSLRDLGRKMFGSMRSLSLRRKPSKK